LSRDFEIKCKVQPRDASGFSASRCEVVSRSHFEDKFTFPCSYDQIIRTIPKGSKVRIEIEPNLMKGVKPIYIGRDLPTKLVIAFPYHRDRFSSWKTFVSSLKQNSINLVSFENLRQRQFVDQQRSDAVRLFLAAR
jgi:hypothetical protein